MLVCRDPSTSMGPINYSAGELPPGVFRILQDEWTPCTDGTDDFTAGEKLHNTLGSRILQWPPKQEKFLMRTFFFFCTQR